MKLITKENYLAVNNLPEEIFPDYSDQADTAFEDLIQKVIKIVNHSFTLNPNFRQYAAKNRTVFLTFEKKGCRVGFPLDSQIPDIAKIKEYKEQKKLCIQNNQSVCLYEEYQNNFDSLACKKNIYIFGVSLNEST